MFVPSYAPPPLEIRDSVAETSYGERLGFVRRVSNFFTGSFAAIVAIALAGPEVPLVSAIAATGSILLALSLVRRLAKGRRMEVVVSSGMMLPFLFACGTMLGGLAEHGFPIWAFALPVLFQWLYIMLCGRDLSYIAMFALPATALGAVWLAADLSGAVSGWTRYFGPLASIGFSFYLAYDLPALLTRRRLGEEMGAVADLFRDLLNFSTYWVRVWRHWRRYPIWPKSVGPETADR